MSKYIKILTCPCSKGYIEITKTMTQYGEEVCKRYDCVYCVMTLKNRYKDGFEPVYYYCTDHCYKNYINMINGNGISLPTISTS